MSCLHCAVVCMDVCAVLCTSMCAVVCTGGGRCMALCAVVCWLCVCGVVCFGCVCCSVYSGHVCCCVIRCVCAVLCGLLQLEAGQRRVCGLLQWEACAGQRRVWFAAVGSMCWAKEGVCSAVWFDAVGRMCWAKEGLETCTKPKWGTKLLL